MNQIEFNKKYKDKGGIETLLQMRIQIGTLQEIADHFGVSKERARQWMSELFLGVYDSRKRRKDASVEQLVNLLSVYSEDEIKRIFPKTNIDYLNEALKLTKKRKWHFKKGKAKKKY